MKEMIAIHQNKEKSVFGLVLDRVYKKDFNEKKQEILCN